MTITAAELIAKVSTTGVDTATGQLTRMGLVADGAGGKFAKLATLGAGVLAVGLVAIGVKSVEMAGNFEAATNRLVTSAGEQNSNIGKVRSAILGLSVDTATGTDQLVKSWYTASSAGFNFAHGGLDVVRAAAMGAKAEGADLGKVTDVLTTAMHDFHLPVSQAVDVVNSFIRTVAEGKGTMDDLTGAMRNVLPIAAAAHVHLKDVEGAIATMSLAGDKGTQAGTHLAQMLTYLLAPSSKATGVLKEVGLTTQGISDEMKKSLPGAIEMITKAVGEKFPVGSAKYIAALSAIVGGNRSMKAMLELSGQNLADYIAHVNKVAPALSANAKQVENWGVIQSGFNFKLDAAKNVVGAFMIELGSKLLPVLGQMLGVLPTIVSYLSNFSAHANVLVPILAGIGAVLVAVLVPAVWSLAAGVIAATWPLLLIGAAVAGLVAIFMHFYQTNAGFKAFIDNLVVGFKQVAQLIMANFIPAMQQVGNWLRTNVLPILQQIGQFLLSTFKPVWQQLVSMWNGQILPSLKQLWAALQPLMPVLAAIGGIILGVVVIAFGLLVGLLAGLVKGIAGFLGGLATVIGGVIQVFTGVVQIISGIVRFIYDLLTGNFSNLGNDLKSIWDGIVNIFAGAWNVIKGLFQAAWGFISGLVSGFVQGIIGFFTMLYNALVGHSIVPDMINGIVSFFASLPGKVFSFVSSLVLGVVNFFLRLAQQAGAAIQRFVLMAVSLFVSLASQLIAHAASLVAGVIGWLLQLPGRAAGAMASLASTVLGALSRLAGQALSAGANIVRNIASGILGAIGSAIGGAMNAVGSFIHDHLPHSPAKLGPLRDLHVQAAMISQQIAEGIAAGSPKIQAAMGSLLKPVSMQVSGSFTPGASRYSFPLAGGQPTIVVNVASPDVNLDGWRVTDRLMPHITSKIRYNIPGGMGR